MVDFMSFPSENADRSNWERRQDETANTPIQGRDCDKTIPQAGHFAGMWSTVPDQGCTGSGCDRRELKTLNAVYIFLLSINSSIAFEVWYSSKVVTPVPTLLVKKSAAPSLFPATRRLTPR
jgi:hypothetical protein